MRKIHDETFPGRAFSIVKFRQLLIFHRLASIPMIKNGIDINVSLEDQTSMAQNVKCLKIVVDVLQEQQ